MKKFLTLAIILGMSIASSAAFVGCGSDEEGGTDDTTTSSETEGEGEEETESE